ncbi:MAG: LD-carboxypeptidase [Candidatus Aminicenantes bacterium]|nr:LD-carboxypeptidase [Candidatus Aminicenantes bacterium]
MSEKILQKVGFIAPSTCLPRNAKTMLNRTAKLIRRRLGAEEIYFSPYLFSMDEQIDHVTASTDDRSADFKTVIRDCDLIISIAGGTGAEDLAFKIDKIDYRVIRNRRPIFIGFSDFAFLLSEIYHHARVPVVYFPTLKLGKGNAKKIFRLIQGEEVHYQGKRWLTPPPPRRISGIPIGGNLSTFVNFLNREKPPKFSWRRHILFIEDIQVDVEDLHRLLAALRRHGVLQKIRGIVIGSMYQYSRNHNYKKNQRDALKFILTYLGDVIRARRKHGSPLPILAVSNFGHNITRDLMAVPIGGRVTISKSKKITFRLGK